MTPMSALCKTRLVRGPVKPFGVRAEANAGPAGNYPGDLAKAYGFPNSGPHRQTVAIIELGGGYALADMQAYAAKRGYNVPAIREISVGGVSNAYSGNPNSADGEVALDMQIVMDATQGTADILMVWCPNTEQGFAQGYIEVANDNTACSESTSWGAEEPAWTAGGMQKMEAAIKACIDNGIPTYPASGDDGSSDGGPGNQVDFPASCIWSIGCGGTTRTTNPESAWSYGGGGVSRNFARPAWQLIGGNKRGVPDVSLDGDNLSGYNVFINGKWYVFGGTSAVAPMWAAWTALVVSNTGKRLGFWLPQAYAKNEMTDITTGSNGAFKAAVGWDPCTGLGVPNAKFTADMIGAAPVPPPIPPPNPPPPIPPPSAQHTLTFSGPYTIT